MSIVSEGSVREVEPMPFAIGPDTARLLVACPDHPGIIAAISRFLYELDANIITSDQYSSDPEHGRFFLRMTFRRPGVDAMREELERAFAAEVGSRFAMNWRISYETDRPRIALMASTIVCSICFGAGSEASCGAR